jgi:hypothetical protein
MNIFDNTTPVLKEAMAEMIAEQIHDGLSKQYFYEWFVTGNWDTYITNNYNEPDAKQQILKEIKEIFKLK